MASHRGLLHLVMLVALLCGVFGGPDNQGKEFIIGYMENDGTNMDLELFVTTAKTTTINVNITAPGYPYAYINEQFTITSGEVKQVFLSNRIRMEGSSKSTKGILVSADDEIVIYGVNKETFSCDAFLGLPTDVTGKEYYAVAYSPPSKQTELLIVGITNGTTVKITLGEAIGNKRVLYESSYYSAGDTITEYMNRFDTLQLTSDGDLTGTFIQSDKEVSFFSGNKKTAIEGVSSDHLVEQLTPVSTWGKDFATVPIPTRTTGDYFRFIASENNTMVTISGGVNKTFTLSTKGNFQQERLSSTAYCRIQSDKPIFVVQFCLSQASRNEPADPMMQIIHPTAQFTAEYAFTTPKYSLGSYNNYFMFVVKDSDKDGLRVDGDIFPNSTVYNSIQGTDYVGGFITLTEGSHNVRHISPIILFGGFLYGQANFETYGFPTGMRVAPINTVCSRTLQVTGDGFDNDCDGLIDEEICSNNKDDDGDGSSDEDCAKPWPIDGMWTSWGSYGACSLTCKDFGTTPTGSKSRSRTCTNPAPMHDGKQCNGTDTSTDICTISTYCPIDGNYTDWTDWTTCSVTCGGGIQSRTRNCTNPAPAYGGANCTGDNEATKACNSTACSIDGNYTDWTDWTTCSVTCGGGIQSRTRNCTNPAPAYGGANCTGDNEATKACNSTACSIDGDWGAWSNWGTCSKNCDIGSQSRFRNCDNPLPAYGGLNCSGNSSQIQNCNNGSCPMNVCQNGWFPCQSGGRICIENSMKCDCDSDCDDGSDESETHANCSALQIFVCKAMKCSASQGVQRLSFGVLFISICLALKPFV